MCLIDLKKAGETLIIFDEIQECPEALNTLKYFKENANEYHVIAAGSLLGTLLAQPKSYPVGMVNLLDIHPLNFEEFLDAVEPALYAYYDNIQKNQQIEEIFHNRLLEAYNNCLIIGGMPECVASWIKYKDPSKISRIQRELIEVYENDFVIQYGTEIIPVETKGEKISLRHPLNGILQRINRNMQFAFQNGVIEKMGILQTFQYILPAKPKNFYNFPDSPESSGESGVSYELEES